MVNSNTLQEVAELIAASKSVIVLSHYNPDADAYGSSCALTIALKNSGKMSSCLNATTLLDRYNFIPGTKEVLNQWPIGEWDTVVVCDCGSLERTGEQFKLQLLEAKKVINIDHHTSNDKFGHHNYVRESASSTSEIIYELITIMGIEITKEIAIAIFSGISGDSGSFRYSCTTAKTFEVASNLVKCGVSPHYISRELYGRSKLGAVMLQADALRGMQLFAGGSAAEVIVDSSMYERFSAGPEDTESIVERVRDIDGIKVSILIKQDGEIWRVSLRSIDAKYNVSKVAESFGGGGHVVAAAFRWRRSVEELRPMLRSRIEELVI